MLRDDNLLDEIIELLCPLVDDDGNRRALVARCCPKMSNEIDFEGPARVFASRLVHKLVTFGEVEPGKPALAALLEFMYGQVGVEKQMQLARLVNKIYEDNRAWGAPPGGVPFFAGVRDTSMFGEVLHTVMAMKNNGGLQLDKLIGMMRLQPELAADINLAVLHQLVEDEGEMRENIKDLREDVNTGFLGMSERIDKLERSVQTMMWALPLLTLVLSVLASLIANLLLKGF
jgi:hypothetical protein